MGGQSGRNSGVKVVTAWLPAWSAGRALLLAYPAEFRHEYGEERERLFAERLDEEPDLEEAEWDRVIDTNLKGCFLAQQQAARRMEGV